MVKAARGSFRVIGHGYVPIQRIGLQADLTLANIGLVAWLKGELGPWLWKPMRHVLAGGEDAGKAFADMLLIDGFEHRVLGRLLARHPDLFAVADFSAVSGAVQDYFWNDEIHPSERGFAELAMAFNHALRRQLPANKQAAVA